MKLKNGAKYRILCEYKDFRYNEHLLKDDVVEIDYINTWCGSGSDVRYGMVYFKNSFPMFAHIFELIAEEVEE